MAEYLSGSSLVLVATADLNLRVDARTASWTRVPKDLPQLEVRFLPSIRFLGERLVRPAALWRVLDGFAPDAVVTSHPSLTGDLAAMFALRRGIPWIATYHGDLVAERPYARAYAWWEARILRRARTVLVHSQGYVQRLVERGLDPQAVFAVTPGPGLENNEPASAVDSPEGRRPGPEHPFLFVGGLDRARAYKRPELLLEAVARLSARGVRVWAWFVGDGDRRAELEARASRLGLVDVVRFLGRLSDQELADAYRRAWALVLPSTGSEGFGVVTLEALEFGCPAIVSSAVGAAPTLLRGGCAVTFEADVPEALDEALQLLWTDVQRRSELAARARETAGQFDWGSALPQIAAPILRAAGATSTGGP